MSLPYWLFVSYGGGHVRALLPVARRVAALGIARPLYLALTTAAASVRAAGIEAIGFADLLDKEDTYALRIGEQLARALQVNAIDMNESVAYLGLSYAALEAQLGPADAAQQYARYGRQAFLPHTVLKRALQRFTPELVVTTNSPRAERAAIEVARTEGVPAVCLVDLLGIWERDLLVQPDYADALCVLSEGVRRQLVEAGRSAGDIHVTGNPAFDGIADDSVLRAGAACRARSGWEGLHVLLYASSPEPRHIPGIVAAGDPSLPRRIETALVRAVESNPELALWVRRHPSEAACDTEAWIGHPRIRVGPPDVSLHALLHACDEVIVTVSTVGIEAWLAGVPVVQVLGSILDHLSPYVELGVACEGLQIDEITTSYAQLVAIRAARLQALRTAPPVGGADATARVVQVLRDTVSSHER